MKLSPSLVVVSLEELSSFHNLTGDETTWAVGVLECLVHGGLYGAVKLILYNVQRT